MSNADDEVSSSLLRNMSLLADGYFFPLIVSISAMSSRYENVWLPLGVFELENNLSIIHIIIQNLNFVVNIQLNLVLP